MAYGCVCREKDHKSIAKQEMKVATIYEGWEKDDGTGSHLRGKRVIAGMEKSNEFHEKREAQIRSNLQCR